MHQVTISIPDQAYARVTKRAEEEGFDSTETFLSDLVVASVDEEEDYQHLFTPDVIAELDAIASGIRNGEKVYTSEEVAAHFAAKRDAWLKDHAS